MNIVLKKLLGDPQAKTVKRLRKRVKEVNALADKYTKLTDAQLRTNGCLKKAPEKRDA